MILYRNKERKERYEKPTSAEDIAKMLGVSMGKSYKILREMNKELAGKGFLTIAGKIPVEYFREKWYGRSQGGCMVQVQNEIQTERGISSTGGQTGQEPRKNHRSEDLRQRKKPRNGMRICVKANLVPTMTLNDFWEYIRQIWRKRLQENPL